MLLIDIIGNWFHETGKNHDEFIPKVIRGKHYDSWTAIAEDMGYNKDSIC